MRPRTSDDPPRKTAPAHHKTVVQLGIAIRKMSAQSVITSRTVADRFGLHTTDLEVLDLIVLRNQASAGELADATGLSSGSVTALIDRLARAGYVERCADADDRRRVIVRIRHDAIEPIKAAYASMQRQMFALWSTYSTRDLQVITDFVSRSTALAVECAKSLGQDQPHASRRSARRSGLGSDKQAHRPKVAGPKVAAGPEPAGTAVSKPHRQKRSR